MDVRHHDDGSEDGMVDLEVVRGGEIVAAVEVTRVVDADATEQSRLLERHGLWVEPSLAGGWHVHLNPVAQIKLLRAELPSLLGALEDQGITGLLPGSWRPGPYERWAARLGITHLHQGPTSRPGVIYAATAQSHEKTTGYASDTGDPLAEWIGAWLRDPDRADNLAKLAASGLDERHMFILVPVYADAPFTAWDALLRRDGPLPTIAPDLPEEITHVWAMSIWDSGSGMRWSPDAGWELFDKHGLGPG